MATRVRYYVYHLMIKSKIVYVGRSISPESRKRSFEWIHKIKTTMKVFEVHSINESKIKELHDICHYRPFFNKRVTSVGGTGYWKDKVGPLLGRKFSNRHIKRLSTSHLNHTPWNKGLKGSQVPWNKGLKGKQVAWNKGKSWPIKIRLKISRTLKERLRRGKK